MIPVQRFEDPKSHLVKTASTIVIGEGGHTVHTQRQDGRGFYLAVHSQQLYLGELIVHIYDKHVTARWVPSMTQTMLYIQQTGSSNGERTDTATLYRDLLGMVRFYLITYSAIRSPLPRTAKSSICCC